MKKIVVLGGGGFIGGHLAKRLKEEGNHVRVCDIKKHEYFFQDEMCHEFILGDLTDPKVVDTVIESGVDEVYQLAADMGGALYIFTGENDANLMHNSAMINLNVSRECVKKKVGKVFYSSSACMYPEHNQLDSKNPNCEESSAYPANPDSEYGWEKLFSERVFLAYHRNYGLNVRIARFHNIFGPQGTWKGGREKSPAAMCRKAVETPNGGEIEVWGDGSQTRDFTHVEDICKGLIQISEGNWKAHNFDLGRGVPVSILDVAKMYTENEESRITHVPLRKNEGMHTESEWQKTYTLIKWRAQNNLEDYIKTNRKNA